MLYLMEVLCKSAAQLTIGQLFVTLVGDVTMLELPVNNLAFQIQVRSYYPVIRYIYLNFDTYRTSLLCE